MLFCFPRYAGREKLLTGISRNELQPQIEKAVQVGPILWKGTNKKESTLTRRGKFRYDDERQIGIFTCTTYCAKGHNATLSASIHNTLFSRRLTARVIVRLRTI